MVFLFAIVLVGLARSGKDTVADFLAEEFGFEKLVFSDLLHEEAKRLGLAPNKMNLAIVGDELRKKEGMGALAKRIWKKAKGKKKVVFVGARSVEEITALKQKISGLVVVKVESDAARRFARRQAEDPQTKKGFFERDKRDIEKKGLGKALEIADFALENNSTKAALFAKTKALLKRFKY